MMKARRVGVVAVPHATDALEKEWLAIRLVFPDEEIVAVCDHSRSLVLFRIYSDRFPVVPDDESVPEYEITDDRKILGVET